MSIVSVIRFLSYCIVWLDFLPRISSSYFSFYFVFYFHTFTNIRIIRFCFSLPSYNHCHNISICLKNIHRRCCCCCNVWRINSSLVYSLCTVGCDCIIFNASQDIEIDVFSAFFSLLIYFLYKYICHTKAANIIDDWRWLLQCINECIFYITY